MTNRQSDLPCADGDEPEHECPDCGSTNIEPSAETRPEYKFREWEPI
jgi:predicted RNA-binding Zn-ribbon protein involved in translation (DUF1610 family)